MVQVAQVSGWWRANKQQTNKLVAVWSSKRRLEFSKWSSGKAPGKELLAFKLTCFISPGFICEVQVSSCPELLRNKWATAAKRVEWIANPSARSEMIDDFYHRLRLGKANEWRAILIFESRSTWRQVAKISIFTLMNWWFVPSLFRIRNFASVDCLERTKVWSKKQAR